MWVDFIFESSEIQISINRKKKSKNGITKKIDLIPGNQFHDFHEDSTKTVSQDQSC